MVNQLRVLQLIDSLQPGGAERMAVNIANGLSERGVYSCLCTTRQQGLLKNQINDDVSYLFLERKSTLDIKALLELRRYIKQHKITHVHAHASSFFIGTILKIFNSKLKLYWHDHYGNSEFLTRRPKKVLLLCSIFFEAIIAVNDLLVKWSKDNLKAKNVIYLPNFVVLKDLRNQKPKTVLHGKVGKRILCLANWRPQKGILDLLAAFSDMNQRHPDWTLHLVGKQFQDAYEREIIETIKNKNLQESVFVYGSCSDINMIISQSEIGVLTSHSEGLPLALLEYGLGGLAVIATNVGDVNQVIEEGNGFRIPAHDGEALINALEELIENPKLRAEYGERLNHKIQNKFSEEASIKRVLELYNEK